MNVLKGNIVAQIAHVCAGGYLTLILTRWVPLAGAAAITLSVFFLKEAIESVWGAWEPIQPWADSLTDWGFFGVGITSAIILKELTVHIFIAIVVSAIVGGILGYAFRGKEVRALQAAGAAVKAGAQNVASKL